MSLEQYRRAIADKALKAEPAGLAGGFQTHQAMKYLKEAEASRTNDLFRGQ